MAVTDLAVRTERVLVGTLLVDPSQSDGLPELRPQDFADPRSRDLFGAIAGTGVALDVEQALTQLGQSGSDITELRGLLSNARVGDAIVYARLVAEAGLRCDLATHAERIAAGAERGTGADPDHAARLAQALRARADLGAFGLGDHNRGVSEDFIPKTTYEDKVLAALLQDREMYHEVRGWLPADCFAPGIRRDIYDAMAVVFDRGEPVNELTVAWQLVRDTPRLDGAGFGYLNRLGAMPVDLIEGLEGGRELLIAALRADTAALAAEPSHTDAVVGQQSETHRPGRQSTYGADRRAPELLEPPPTPQLGPDGPRIGW